ncbi:MAG: hypothetical protein Q7J28_02360 [Caulobacter sp.]|nr:hypothetical protein [Caulobacter sp.]
MAAIDIARTAAAGLGVIARRPLAVLAWAGVLLLLGVLPAAGLMSAFLGALAEIARMDASGVEPSPDALVPAMSAAFAMQPVLLLTSLAVRAILTGAVFRAVLEPAESRWFYLRLGARELWLALMIVVFGILSFLVLIPVSAVLVPLLMVLAMGAEGNLFAVVPIMLAAVLIALAVLGWLFVRFSMALPMTFTEQRFRLFESWTMTQGQTWRLISVGLLLVGIVLALELALLALLVVASLAFLGEGGLDEAAASAFFAQDASIWMAELAPWAVGMALVGALLGAVVTTILAAPWAEAYRQLSGAPPAE